LTDPSEEPFEAVRKDGRVRNTSVMANEFKRPGQIAQRRGEMYTLSRAKGTSPLRGFGGAERREKGKSEKDYLKDPRGTLSARYEQRNGNLSNLKGQVRRKIFFLKKNDKVATKKWNSKSHEEIHGDKKRERRRPHNRDSVIQKRTFICDADEVSTSHQKKRGGTLSVNAGQSLKLD